MNRSTVVADKMQELKIMRILNASYSPNYNPVEGAIGMVKAITKKLRLDAIVKDEKVDLNKLIKHSFMGISIDVCHKFINKSN